MPEMNKPSIDDFRELAGPGYNLAAIVPMDHDLRDTQAFYARAVPVLDIAKGPLGVLRAMETRRPGIQACLADGQEHRMVHLEFVEGGIATLNDYRFTVVRA